jgi:uncharacterized membrane protein YhaH (DUF805 family)
VHAHTDTAGTLEAMEQARRGRLPWWTITGMTLGLSLMVLGDGIVLSTSTLLPGLFIAFCGVALFVPAVMFFMEMKRLGILRRRS